MNVDVMLEEAERLQKASRFLKASGDGQPVGLWCDPDDDYEDVSGLRRWMTLRADALPNPTADPAVYFSIFTGRNLTGRLTLIDWWPPVKGTWMYAHPARMLPPIDVVFPLGSARIGEWLKQVGWSRKERPNPNFPEWAVVEEYQEQYFRQHPVWNGAEDVYAITGGWHMPTQWSDFHRHVKAKLLVTTVRDSEPWVEVFRMTDARYRVVQRVT